MFFVPTLEKPGRTFQSAVQSKRSALPHERSSKVGDISASKCGVVPWVLPEGIPDADFFVPNWVMPSRILLVS